MSAAIKISNLKFSYLNNKNIFAVNINGRIDGNLITEKDFYKYYIESRY